MPQLPCNGRQSCYHHQHPPVGGKLQLSHVLTCAIPMTSYRSFTTGSTPKITSRLLNARDDALSRVGEGGPRYMITDVTDAPRDFAARQVEGIMFTPQYISQVNPGARSRVVVDAEGKPLFQGNMEARFSVIIPDSCVGRGWLQPPCKVVQYGHGLFGDQDEIKSTRLAEFVRISSSFFGCFFFCFFFLVSSPPLRSTLARVLLNYT